MKTLKICVAYELDGRTIDNFPASVYELERCRPVYEEMPGWETSTSACRKYEDLPENAQKYLERLEQHIGCPVNFISVGSARDEVIIKSPL